MHFCQLISREGNQIYQAEEPRHYWPYERRTSTQVMPTIAVVIPSSIASYKTVILDGRFDVSTIDLVAWTSVHGRERLTHLILFKTGTASDFIEELSKRVRLTPTGAGKIRFLKWQMAERRGKDLLLPEGKEPPLKLKCPQEVRGAATRGLKRSFFRW